MACFSCSPISCNTIRHVSFVVPMNLDVKAKAAVLGAVFLIVSIYVWQVINVTMEIYFFVVHNFENMTFSCCSI